jgi:ABC-type glycerol-3-phosphate transport system substrate-binding protein
MSNRANNQSQQCVSRRSFLIGSGAAIAAATLSACAPPGAVQQASEGAAAPAEGVTLTFTTGQHANFPFDTLMFQEWQKATGVAIDWKLQPSPSLGDKVKLMLSAGDVTDIVIGPRAILRELGPEACLPLDDLIQQHMPNYSQVLQEFADAVPPTRSPDGKFYGI